MVKMHSSQSPLLLSVVVIGRNEGIRLTRCFESIKKMESIPDAYEFIYVDSASSDDSVLRAKTFGAKIIHVNPPRPAAAIARNAGWKAASGEIILFLDGDTILEPAFVNTSLSEFSKPKIAAVCGHRREISPYDSIYNRILDLDWIYPIGDAQFFGGDVLIRRRILEEVNGYDPTLIAGEEPEMCTRILGKGYQILRLDKTMTMHDLAIKSFGQYWKRAFRTGYAYAEVSRKFQNSTQLWKADSLHNLFKGSMLLAIPLIGILAYILFHTILPLVVMLLIVLLLICRTAWKARKKSFDLLTCILYGFHAHLQHIPIFFGQMAYFWGPFQR